MKVLEAIDTCNVAWLVEVSVGIVRGHYVDGMQAFWPSSIPWFAISMVSKMKKKANFPDFAIGRCHLKYFVDFVLGYGWEH